MNLTRAAQGILPLPEIPELLEVAQKHSDKMAAEQWMHHSTDAVFEFLPPGWLAYGENVVYGKTCEQMFDAFMNSDPHRDAMLRADFNYSGTAVAYSSDGWIYAAVVFLHLPYLPPSLLPPAEAPPGPVPSVPAPGPAAQPPLEAPPPVPSPAVQEPVPSITFGPFPTPAAPEADSAGAAEVPAEGPRRIRRPSAKDAPRASKTRGKAGRATSPVRAANEAYVWVLEDEPGRSPEEEPDPSQMDFDLDAELPAPGSQPGV